MNLIQIKAFMTNRNRVNVSLFPVMASQLESGDVVHYQQNMYYVIRVGVYESGTPIILQSYSDYTKTIKIKDLNEILEKVVSTITPPRLHVHKTEPLSFAQEGVDVGKAWIADDDPTGD